MVSENKFLVEDTKSEENHSIMNLGRTIPTPNPGDSIVISGISGSFPYSDNVLEFRENLFNKVNMVEPNKRWDLIHPEIPPCTGTIPEIGGYDLGFFGIHKKQADSLDVQISMLHEKVIEAIFDAGMHPSDLQNTRTGVYVGSCFSENEKMWFFDKCASQTYCVTGSTRSMMAHRLSYLLKLNGPSYITDTACSSSLYALEHAFRSFQLREIDTAIVAGANLCLHPMLSLQFARLGVLSKDGCCKTFDELGNGYVRSETIGVLILQRAKIAKRIYAEVVYAKTNCDGFKEQGITFPSRDAQFDLLDNFYDECGVDRSSLSYLEAHGTGTFIGDPEECSAIDEVFTRNRKKSLLVGSVKSNVGHSEPASGVCAIIKCIIGMETGLIPPNIHYNRPRPVIKGLTEGRMKVVTEKTPFEDDRGLIGVNSFGFGGGNCHVLLRWNPKSKQYINDVLPRLVCLSGRTKQGVNSLLNSVIENKYDPEYIKLLHDSFRKNVENHPYRGYTILSQSGETMRSINYLKYFPNNAPLIYLAFGELKNWWNIGTDLMAIPAFSTFIQRVQMILLKQGVNILDVFLKKISNEHIGLVLGSVIVQMALIELLNLVELKPHDKFGYSIGELLSAYCEGSLSFEEAITYAFIIDNALNNLKETIFACNNNNNYQESKSVNDMSMTNGNSIRNGYVPNQNGNSVNDVLSEYLCVSSLSSKTINLDKLKDNILQSILKNVGSATDGKRIKTFVNALFSDKINIVPPANSIVLKIGDSPSDKYEDVSIISLFSEKNSFVGLLTGLGRLYEFGYNPQISKLYPPIKLPVSRGTGMISPHIKWNHRNEKYVPQYITEDSLQVKHGGKTIMIHINDPEWTFIEGHVIDGRNLFPATGYLYLVWQIFAEMKDMTIDVMQVCFENCKFIRATTVPKGGYLPLNVNINSGTGKFEVVHVDSLVVTGRISLLEGSKRSTFQNNPPNFKNLRAPKLNNKDVYKELRLRGYAYQKEFRSIEECDTSVTEARIRWNDNWVAFMDNMLQLFILQTDTRMLYVPTTISKLTIKADIHVDLVAAEKLKEEETLVLPVTVNSLTGSISSGGIKLEGLIASSIPRKKITTVPVLESYRFVPNITELPVEQSVRVNMQIVLENSLTLKVKAAELVDEFTDDNVPVLSPIIKSVLEDQPLIQPFLKILSSTVLNEDVEVENKKLRSESDCVIVVASRVLSRPNILEEAFSVLTDDGFILSREPQHINPPESLNNFTIFTIHQTSHETLILLRKTSKIKQSKYIRIDQSQDFNWLSDVQNAIYKEKNEDIVLYTENEPKSGIVGFVNCLRREPQSKHVRCVFVMDKASKFEPQEPFFSAELNKKMAVNIYKEGQWGTYRHLPLEKQKYVNREHCLLNLTARGDLSSLRWMEGPLRHDMNPQTERELIYVYYSALNFRDIMTASGKINADVITKNRLEQECVQGCEFSGKDIKGNRYMGMTNCGALSTLILAETYMKFPIPDDWSLEEAATVPVVYGTVIYGLIMLGQMKKGESILIHSGIGGIGQAAIRLALCYGCKVFTTVGSQEKREFLKKIFPQLEEANIGNSHDESFEQMVYCRTKGRGVDLVLNSLAEEKLVASVRCLARGGRFIEIGKFDLASNNSLNALLLEKEASFQGVMLDLMFKATPQVKKVLVNVMTECIKQGMVKPLNRTVFKYEEAEQAFRFMASGKHKGKVLIQVREEEKKILAPPTVLRYPCIPRFYCNPDKVYVILGGLGGFGLELADWLILRGAKKLVLTSRQGVTTGYQNYRLSIWKNYDIVVKVSTTPITTSEGCERLIEECLELGPIDGIFNLAVVLADALFENQTIKDFTASFQPKACATQYLDEITRVICPDLSQFVVFSSVSCGRGNAGQTNYGMSNSVMERICENRKRDGYPALAIEWGAIGEVGLVAEMLEDNTKMEIGGTLQQRISDCLQVMDIFLAQNEAPIVSSLVVAEKKSLNSVDNIVDAVINILGVTDSKSISLHSTLSEMGMDSMTAVEIKQILETEFEVFLSAKDMRSLTLAKLKDVQNDKLNKTSPEDTQTGNLDIEMIFKLIGDEKSSYLPFVELSSAAPPNSDAPTLLMFGGIEGSVNIFQDFVKHISARTIGVQLNLHGTESTILEMAQSVMPTVEKYISNHRFALLGYSYGSMIALEVASILESRGYNGTVICIDGAPLLMNKIGMIFHKESEKEFETGLLCYVMSFYMPAKQTNQFKESIFICENWVQRLDLMIDIIKQHVKKDVDYDRLVADSVYRKVKAIIDYSPSYGKLRAKVKLIKPTQVIITDLPEDYGLSELLEDPVEISTFPGNHNTILDNEDVAQEVNSCLKNVN